MDDGKMTAVSGGVASPRFNYHTVLEGETMASIAKDYGTTEKNLRFLNNMGDSEQPEPGSSIMVPVG